MTPWTGRLLFANVVVFVVTYFADPGRTLMAELLLIPAEIPSRPWTAVTYMFLHGGTWHLIVNMIILFFFGPRLEVRLGTKHFLGLYFLSGLAAAGVSWIFTPGARIVGASGAIFGVLLGFARYWPRERLLIWGVFPMEARWLVGLSVAFSLFGGFGGVGGNIAHFAHLGGFVGGWIYLAAHDRRGGRTRARSRALDRIVEAGKKAAPTRKTDRKRWESIEPTGLHEVNRENLERIREKIEEKGTGSLTRRERDFLDRLARRQEEGGADGG